MNNNCISLLIALLFALALASHGAPAHVIFTEPSNGKVVSLNSLNIIELATYDPAQTTHSWKLVGYGEYYYIVGKNSDQMAVDVGNNAIAGAKLSVTSKKTEGNVDSQLWKVILSSTGSITGIQSKVNVGLYLGVEATKGFVLKTTPTPVEPESFYFALSKNGKYLSLLTPSSNEFGFVSFNVSDEKQHWFHHGGFIINRAKAVALDVEGAKPYHGTKVLLWNQKPFNSATRSNQQWTAIWHPTLPRVNFETKVKAGLHLRQGVSGSGLFIAYDVLPNYAFNVTDVDMINACDSSPCHTNATCTDLPNNRYSCQCKTGYEGDGTNCNKVNSVVVLKFSAYVGWHASSLELVINSPDRTCKTHSSVCYTQDCDEPRFPYDSDCEACGFNISEFRGEGTASYDYELTVTIANLTKCSAPGKNWEIWLQGMEGAYYNDGDLLATINGASLPKCSVPYTQWKFATEDDCPCIKKCYSISPDGGWTYLA